VARTIIGLLTLLCIADGGLRRAADARQDAMTVWANAVAAKGGQARLGAVRSFAVLEKAESARATLPRMSSGKVDQIVCELPDGWWEFIDYRPGQMGYAVSVINARTGMGWASHGGAAKPLLQPDTFTGYRMRQIQYVYFLQTSAVRPTPRRSSRVQLGSRPVDHVETDVDGEIVHFYLDATTHLPVRIETVRKAALPPPRPGLTPRPPSTIVYELDAYHEVGGIQVPRRVLLGAERFESTVEINPQIDPSLFTTPPPADARIDSWRGGPREKSKGASKMTRELGTSGSRGSRPSSATG